MFQFYGTNVSKVASVILYAKDEFRSTFKGAVHIMKVTAYDDSGKSIDVTNSGWTRINYLFPNRNGKIIFLAR